MTIIKLLKYKVYICINMSLNKNNAEALLVLLIGVLAILAVKSIFEDDNSKIVSKKGRKLLLDNKKMEDLNKRMNSIERRDINHEIFV